MTTLTKPRTVRSLFWQTFRLLGRLGWVLVIFFVLGILVVEVLLLRAGRWAEVLGSGLTNLLCMVGVTGVYWEERGREETSMEGG